MSIIRLIAESLVRQGWEEMQAWSFARSITKVVK